MRDVVRLGLLLRRRPRSRRLGRERDLPTLAVRQRPRLAVGDRLGFALALGRGRCGGRRAGQRAQVVRGRSTDGRDVDAAERGRLGLRLGLELVTNVMELGRIAVLDVVRVL